MDTHSLYRDDIYAWSIEQAEILRDMAGNPGLPNTLDLENVAEEIESVGGDIKRGVESFIRLVLVHLLKAAAQPDSDAQTHWRSEILNFQAEIQGRYTRAMRQDIDLDRVWRRAASQAKATLSLYGDTMPALNDSGCPLSLDDLIQDEFDLAKAVELVRATMVRDEQA